MTSKKRENLGLISAVALILLASFLASVVNDRNNNLETTGQATQIITGYATQGNFGTITSCTVDRNVKGSTAVCTPPTGPIGTTKIGTYEEYNGWGQWYNAYSIYVSDNVKASLVKCQLQLYWGSTCNLPDCPAGTTLQSTLFEAKFSSEPSAGTIINDWKYGICANVNITVKSCIQDAKGRSCSTKSPGTDFLKLSNYITDIVNYIGATRYFRYYDFYIQQVEPVTTPSLPTHCSSNVWDGDESDLDCGGSCNKCADTLSCWDNSDCSSSTCYFDSATQQKRTAAGIQPTYRSTLQTDIQYQGVCQGTTGGTCSGTDCGTLACRSDKNACNSNSINCAWDDFEEDPNQPKCKSINAICNTAGIKICNFKDFLAGDYSCLRKQGNYYTEACVGSGGVGFWNIPETYRNA